MAKPENGLWDFLRARMPVGTHYSRIESLETAPGFPDVHYTLKRVSGGMELKCQEFPQEYPFPDNTKGLRKSQHQWIRDELAAGGKVILVLQVRHRIYFIDGAWHSSLEAMTEEVIASKAFVIWDRLGACDVAALHKFMTQT